MPPKKALLPDSAIDFAALGDSVFSAEGMSPLLESYYTPDLALDPFGERPATFTEAIAEENAVVEADLKTSDRLQRIALAMHSGIEFAYFTCVVFVSDAQCTAFLKASGWDKYTNGTTQYVNGVLLARDMGITLPAGYLAEAKPLKAKKKAR